MESGYVLGVDQSLTSSGVCLLDFSSKIIILQRIIPAKNLRDAQRLHYIKQTLQELIRDRTALIKLACMEGYAYNATNKKFLLGECGAAIKLALVENNIPLLEVAPKQLKKFVSGRGTVSKEQVQASIQSRWNEEISQHDCADAYGLARVALMMILNNSNNRAELEVLKKLSSPPLKKPKRRGRLSALANAL